MRNTVRSILSLTALSMLATAAQAQEGLLEIFQLALDNDPTWREAEANLLVELEVKPQARSSILPSLDFSAGRSDSYRFSTNPQNATSGEPSDILRTESESDGDNWSINLSQTVFNWGQYLTLQQADKRVARAEIVYETARQELFLRVAEAYFNVLAAEDLLAAEVAARESTARQLDQAQARFEVDLIAITEVQQAQAAYDNAVATEISAQRNLATTQEFLREIVGVYVTELRGPTDELPLEPPSPQSADDWVEAALDQNLSLLSSRIAQDIAQDDIKIQRSVRMPTLSLSAGYNENSSSSVSTVIRNAGSATFPAVEGSGGGRSLSLNFRIPLFAGGANASRIRQSVYRHRAAIEGVERVARQTERQTRDAYLGVISTISQVRALRQAVESSRTALRAAEAGFEVDTQTIVDVLAAQNNLRRAETNYARARYDYILNVLRLRQAAGTLSIEDIEQVDGWLE